MTHPFGVLAGYTIEVDGFGDVLMVEHFCGLFLEDDHKYEILDPGNRMGGSIYGKILKGYVNARSEPEAVEMVNHLRDELILEGKFVIIDRRATNFPGRRKHDRC